MNPILDLNNIAFEVGDKKILTDITFKVNEGEIITFTGPSGSGKSTLLKLIGLLISPTSGTIHYKNKDLSDYEPTEYRKQVSYFFQNAVLFDETVRDNLSFPAKIREKDFDEKRAIEGLEAVQLSAAYLDQPIHELSGGERQRVALIRNLMYPPKVLLMDEVTSSLDKENREIVSAFVTRLNEQEKVTVLWITHNEEEINASHRIIHLEDGKMEEITNGK